MKLINPRGKEVHFSTEKAKKILANPVKVLQGWKKKVVKKTTKKKVDGQSDNKK